MRVHTSISNERVTELNGSIIKWTIRPLSLSFRSKRTKAVFADDENITEGNSLSFLYRLAPAEKVDIDHELAPAENVIGSATNSRLPRK